MYSDINPRIPDLFAEHVSADVFPVVRVSTLDHIHDSEVVEEIGVVIGSAARYLYKMLALLGI